MITKNIIKINIQIYISKWGDKNVLTNNAYHIDAILHIWGDLSRKKISKSHMDMYGDMLAWNDTLWYSGSVLTTGWKACFNGKINQYIVLNKI